MSVNNNYDKHSLDSKQSAEDLINLMTKQSEASTCQFDINMNKTLVHADPAFNFTACVII